MSDFVVSILESFLGEHRKHNEDTGQIAFDCPACSEDKGMYGGDGKGNLEINYNLGKYRCWACQDTNNMYGNVGNLLDRYATPKNKRDYLLVKPDTLDYISKVKSGIIVTLPEGYTKFSKCTGKEYKYDQAIRYLRDRGITDEIIDYYNIGFTTIGKYHDRIIIPSYDIEGKLNYFIARWFLKEYTKIKYLNPEAEKSEIIFNHNKVNTDATIYLVEGATDHIVTPNSIPLLGKYITDDLIVFLHDNAKSFIVIVLDDDAYDDAVNLYRKLNFGDLTGRIKIVRCPEGFDPSKVYEKLGAKGIIKLLMSAKRIVN